jgi:hypothetical protein
MQIAGMSELAPDKRPMLAELGMRALLGGTDRLADDRGRSGNYAAVSLSLFCLDIVVSLS